MTVSGSITSTLERHYLLGKQERAYLKKYNANAFAPATGAGKSSLINCVFRLMELDSGKITIDGIDISRLGVKQLRSRMAIIPQVRHSSATT